MPSTTCLLTTKVWQHLAVVCLVCCMQIFPCIHAYYVLNIVCACHCSALDSDPGDVKARFRRSQAFLKLGRLDQAFMDAQRCAQLEPKNKAFQDLLRQLGAQIQQKVMT